MRILLVNEYVESRGAEQIVKEQLNVLTKMGIKLIVFASRLARLLKRRPT